MTRYVMVADLERCVGCQTCTAACRHSNATSPAVQWRKVLDIEAGSFPNVRRTFVPVGCQHCAEPPCMDVCPTTATRQRADGIVTVDYDICIGCSYCEVACPYQARFKVDEPAFAFGGMSASEGARMDPRRNGVSQKCTFCSDRVDSGLAKGLVPGVDAEATPACVNSCIASALSFGDMHDATSPVSKLLAENSGFRMHEELGTQPGFFYLQDHRHVKAPAAFDASAPVRGVDIDPVHQQHWDWKAAANFLCGGAGSVLLIASVIAAARIPAALALILMAIGLFVLLFKIGRPLRFIHVLRQPKRSWMSREAWIAGFMFPLGATFVLTGSPTAGAIAAVLAAGFVGAQAMILKASKGIPAWRTPHIVPLILGTAIAEGVGLFCIWNTQAMLLAAALILRAVLWRNYARHLEGEGAPTRTLQALRKLDPSLIWAGTALPLALLTLAALLAQPLVVAAAGLVAVLSGWLLKFVVITRAGYQQGFALKFDQGTLRPGWSPGRVDAG
jgi:Fe-S-cluster-containing dehydrogenase component/DMSO reductase anchor subunit